MSGTCGRTLPTALGFYDQASSSWRTWQLTLDEDSTLSPKTWPRSGMTRRGQLYALPMSVPATNENDSGCSPLLPTPHANCARGPGRRGRNGGTNLQTAVAELLKR